ncbi:hypothetical protein RIF29_22219 [Crotalaria pallida]|uniref:Uncharacterized protein n=1 Tax=Crotalaria pallida TaxID=3830 RepID=A0AAN9F4K9_CROPI
MLLIWSPTLSNKACHFATAHSYIISTFLYIFSFVFNVETLVAGTLNTNPIKSLRPPYYYTSSCVQSVKNIFVFCFFLFGKTSCSSSLKLIWLSFFFLVEVVANHIILLSNFSLIYYYLFLHYNK